MGFVLPSASPVPLYRRRLQAVMLGMIATFALTITAFAHDWFMLRTTREPNLQTVEDQYGRGGFGLASYVYCPGGSHCHDAWNKQVIDSLRTSGPEAHASLAFAAFGILTLGCLVFGAGGLVVSMLMVGARKRVKPPPAPSSVATIALSLSLAFALIMTWTRPEVVGVCTWDVGPSWWIFVAGAIAGIVSARLLAPHLVGDIAEHEIARARQLAR